MQGDLEKRRKWQDVKHFTKYTVTSFIIRGKKNFLKIISSDPRWRSPQLRT